MNKYLLTLIISLFSLSGCIDSEEVGKVRPVETALIADYIAKWQSSSKAIIQDGVYTSSFSFRESSVYLTANTTYIFENGYMSYESKIHGRNSFLIPLKFSFSGKAKYKAKNGLLTFSDVTGDGALFPLYPTPYEVVNQGDTIIIHEFYNEGDINLSHLTRLKK